ncbi:MAG: NADH-quinone oxidoreductase subunit NuoI [Armatimonadetes bacterium]|nr:MAG: NADH-quinone oxidoreductase subunit NuoI [Armatimonadota bacterium]
MITEIGKDVIRPIVSGLLLTAKRLRRDKTTVFYPEQKRQPFPRTRWRHVLKRYENGLEKCIGCSLCAGACPAKCIYVEAADNTDEERYSPGERYAKRYEINMLRCIFCGFCQEACPTGAIVLRSDFELADYSRPDFIYTKERLLEPMPEEAGSGRDSEAAVQASAP